MIAAPLRAAASTLDAAVSGAAIVPQPAVVGCVHRCECLELVAPSRTITGTAFVDADIKIICYIMHIVPRSTESILTRTGHLSRLMTVSAAASAETSATAVADGSFIIWRQYHRDRRCQNTPGAESVVAEPALRNKFPLTAGQERTICDIYFGDSLPALL